MATMNSTEYDEREEELGALTAIYPELALDASDTFSATLQLAVTPASPLLVRFIPTVDPATTLVLEKKTLYAQVIKGSNAHVEHDVKLCNLPPLNLCITLPKGYPEDAPPVVRLTAEQNWLPRAKVEELENEAAKLWEEYGRCQILYSYIDFLQQAVEKGFDLDASSEGCLVLPAAYEAGLVTFDLHTEQKKFNAGTYDCGVCLEPKKGSACYRMSRCGHVFCKQCLQDFYNNAIKEGDVAGVRCLDPSCGKEKKRKRKTERTVHPRELLAMGIDETVARRYVEMKRKKNIEVDKSTVYCPRTWCQAPAKSDKYPPIPSDLTTYISNEPSDEESDSESGTNEQLKNETARTLPPDPAERLAVCEKCTLAFCKVCYMGWHGQFATCYPRDPNELSAEEKASYDYILKNTTPCSYCNAPVQKTHGCNHMNCVQCRTHFCYLCSSWLAPDNPYQHFNKPGTPCYQRLWELEEGDDGQAPEDGRGFAGGRGWEQMALDAARQADAQEADAAAREAQAEEDARGAAGIPVAPEAPPPRAEQVPLVVAMANAHLDADDAGDPPRAPPPAPVQVQRGARRQRNPFPAHPRGNGAANAVRNHERRRPPAVHVGDGRHDLNDREQEELQRFLELARDDREEMMNWHDAEEDDEIPIRRR